MQYFFLSLWYVLDPFYYLFTRLTYLPDIDETKTRNVFRVRLTSYKGRDITLSDGTRIAKNDILVKIHLHNARLLKDLKQIKSDVKKAKLIYRAVEESLPGIHHYIENHEKAGQIKAIIGITSLYKACGRLGFEVVEISNPIYRRFKWITFMPIILLSSNKKRMQHFMHSTIPRYLFISKTRLGQLYRNT
ncbi:YkoP family protein [Peribacillus sp. SCS-155]|uniref:YkoP family protein n=1 Tax=Peribacillus sedimenti TaxID=3115297 RepID=UPI0039061431